MIPRVLLCLALGVTYAACPARGQGTVAPVADAATATGTAPSRAMTPEEADLQAANFEEAAMQAQVAAGGDARQAMARLDTIYTELEQKYPRSAAVKDAYGDYLWLALRKPEAFAKWQAAENLDPNNPDICLHLGTCWMEQGDTRRATGYFEKASALAPRDALLHFHLGNDLFLFRHDLATPQEPEAALVDRALRELKQAVDLAPADAGYAKGYADTFYLLEKPDWPAAQKAWLHFQQVSPEKDLAALNLARVSLRLNENGEARRYLDQVKGADFQPLKHKLLRQADGSDGQ